MGSQSSAPAGRRSRRGLFIVLGVLAVLIILVVVLLPLLLDPERHRGRIESALREATGWNAELGAIDLSIWRGMALTVNPARLSAPDGSSGFDIETIAIKAELWPLFRGQLAVNRIDLLNPEIRLVRPSVEQGWVLPLGSGEPTESGADAESSGPGVTVEQVQIRGGRLELQDMAAAPPWSFGLEQVDVTLLPEAGEMSGRGELTGGGSVEWRGRFDEGLVLNVTDVATERLHAWIGEGLVHAGGRLSGEFRFSLPLAVEGRLTGTNLTLLAGVEPLGQADVEFRVASGEQAWRLEQLILTAGGARLEGSGALLPTLDLDFVLPQTSLETALQLSAAALPLPLDLTPPGSVEARVAVDRPAEGRLTYAAEGRLTAARFVPSEMMPPATDIVAEFDLNRAGALEIRLLEGSLGGGPIEGVATMASIDPPGTLRFEGSLREAGLGQLLAGFVPGASERILGPTSADVSVGLNLGGDTFTLRDLGGKFRLEAEQVSLPGWDLEAAVLGRLHDELGALSQLAALFDSDLASRLDEPATADRSTEPILDKLGLGLDFDSWPWRLRNFRLVSGDLRAVGRGSFNPDSGAVQAELIAHFNPRRSAELVEKNSQLRYLLDDRGRLSLPLGVGGSLMSPSFSVDLGDVVLRQLGGDEPQDALKGLLEGLLGKDDDD